MARRVGDRSSELAHRIGPKRGLIGLAIVAAAVTGGILLVRYLRARAEEREIEEGAIGNDPSAMPRRRKGRGRNAADMMSH